MKQRKKSATRSQSSVTLLDFFPTKPVLPTSKAPQREKGSKRKLQPATRKPISPDEIIVIDSDSDKEAVEIVGFIDVKRRKLSPEPVASASRLQSDVIGVQDSHSAGKLDSHNGAQGSKGTTPEGTHLSFGVPFLLQGTLAPGICANASFQNNQGVVNRSGPMETLPPAIPAESSSAFIPRETEADGRVAGDLGLATSFLAECTPAQRTLSVVEVDFDLTLDEWDTGDGGSHFAATIQKEEEEEEFLQRALMPEDDGIEIVETFPPFKVAQSSSSTERTGGQRTNAFSVLMSASNENQEWQEATKVEDKSFRPIKENGGRRKAPFYKVLQGMPIAVDAFKYGSIPGVTAYFLTHAHSDHYTNLSSNWKNGLIYCSEGTANLIIHMLSVDKKWVHPLPMDVPTVIPHTSGVRVTLIEANHCPGSCLFFFEGSQTVNAGDSSFKSSYIGTPRTFRYLHCGDFRASPRHVLHPAVRGKVIDHIYLDTTYLDPKYTFPPQPLVISACADLAKQLENGKEKQGSVASWMTVMRDNDSKNKGPRKPVLFVVGTYSVGKERIVKAVAHALNSKIFCDKRKAAILRCQPDPELHSLLTSDPMDAVVHLLPLGMITSDKLKSYLEHWGNRYSKVVGFRPTGWTYVQPSGTDQLPSIQTILTRTVQKTFTFKDLKASEKSTSTLQLYPIPYSEHSSFYELTCFAMSLNWDRMIATVNVGSEASRGKMARWFTEWEAERKRQGKVQAVSYRHPDYW